MKPPANLDLATIQQQELANTFRFHISQYLQRRVEDWRVEGFTETLANWQSLNAVQNFGETTNEPHSKIGKK